MSDDPSLERLAALEGREVPHGSHLVAEVADEVVAALSLVGGEFLADPFRPTEHLLPLMRTRAAQLHAPSRSAQERWLSSTAGSRRRDPSAR